MVRVVPDVRRQTPAAMFASELETFEREAFDFEFESFASIARFRVPIERSCESFQFDHEIDRFHLGRELHGSFDRSHAYTMSDVFEKERMNADFEVLTVFETYATNTFEAVLILTEYWWHFDGHGNAQPRSI